MFNGKRIGGGIVMIHFHCWHIVEGTERKMPRNSCLNPGYETYYRPGFEGKFPYFKCIAEFKCCKCDKTKQKYFRVKLSDWLADREKNEQIMAQYKD